MTLWGTGIASASGTCIPGQPFPSLGCVRFECRIPLDVCTTDACLSVNTCSNRPFAGCCELGGDCPQGQGCRAESNTCEVIAIAAAKSEELLIDLDGNGVADGGDTLRYRFEVWVDTPSLPANDVVLTDTPGPGTGLVVGSVSASVGTVTEPCRSWNDRLFGPSASFGRSAGDGSMPCDSSRR